MGALTPRISAYQQGDTLVVQFQVDNLLGIPEIEAVERELHAVITDSMRNAVLDFANVRYAGSAALAMMLALRSQVDRRGGRLIIAEPRRINDLLRLSKTEHLFETAENAQAALSALAK